MFYIVQAGAALQVVDTTGAIFQTLTLPTGVTIDATKRGRFAVLGQQIVFVNAGTINLWIDPLDFTVRPMSILPPVSAPTLAVGAAGALTGAYRMRVSYGIKDEAGVVLLETPLGPPSAPVTLSADMLDFTNVAISPETTVNFRRLYRTVAGGDIYFAMFDLDDNETTAGATNMLDASLELLPADPELGNPPGAVPGTAMELVVAWRNRLWGKSRAASEVDEIKFSDFDRFYAWARANFLNAQPKGEDATGIVLFLPRRDELVVVKRRRVMKVTGFSEDDFEVIVVAEGVGGIASDSGVIVRDVGYFLGTDGVAYSIGPDGLLPISNDKVDPWFKSDTYFNRALFPDAIGGYNPATDCVEWQLAAAGSSVLDRWVAYDIRRKEWLGPHYTDKFTPTARALLADEDGESRPVIGSSDGKLYMQNQAGASDGATTAIPISWQTKAFNGNAPKLEKFWGKPTFHVKNQGFSAGAVTVTPQVGELGTPAGDPLLLPQNTSDSELDRLGSGQTAQLTFTHSTNAEDVDLRGFELPYVITGDRPTPL
jgi:hypothetical protein